MTFIEKATVADLNFNISENDKIYQFDLVLDPGEAVSGNVPLGYAFNKSEYTLDECKSNVEAKLSTLTYTKV